MAAVHSKRRGFTLIELLVVLSIVAVLAGLTLPVVSNVKESGNSAKCLSNLRQIGTALNLYAADNNNAYPALTTDGTDWDKAAILPYLPGRNRAGQSYQVQNAVFLCPSAKYAGYTADNLSRTYTATDCLAGPKSANYSTLVPNNRNALGSMTGNLLLFDGCQSTNAAYAAVSATWPQVSGGADLQANGTTSTYIDYRHRKAFHGLYADGHVETIKRADAARLITVQVWRAANQQDN